MSRFLFVTLPLMGHAHAIAAVAAQLEAHGHEVMWRVRNASCAR